MELRQIGGVQGTHFKDYETRGGQASQFKESPSYYYSLPKMGDHPYM